MRLEDFDEFREGIAGVYAFYVKDVSQFAADVWWNAMRQFDLPAVTQAFNRHLMNPDTGQFLPKPADIVRMLGGRTQDRALMAWAKVDKAVRQVGTYESVAFDDPIIHRVLHEMGGWVALGQKDEKEWPFVAKEFENRYRSYASRGETPEYPPLLIGIERSYNDAKGLKSGQPRLIGNPIEAQRVMSCGATPDLIGAGHVGDMLRLIPAGQKKEA